MNALLKPLSVLIYVLLFVSILSKISTIPLNEADELHFRSKGTIAATKSKYKIERLQHRSKRDIIDNSESSDLDSTEDLINRINSSQYSQSLDENEDQQFFHNSERRKQERVEIIKSQIVQRLRVKPDNDYSNMDSNIFNEKEQQHIEDMIRRVNVLNRNTDNSGIIDDDYYRSQDNLRNPSNTFPDRSTAIRRPLHTRTGVQWLQSFYPSCTLHELTDSEIWEHSGTFRLYYNLPLHRYTRNTEVEVLFAKLRLYKTNDNLLKFTRSSNTGNTAENNSKIRVSIYQLLRPLRTTKRERKRLVDSKLIPLNKQGWIEFDVAPTISYLLQHNHRNYGFDIQVEYGEGNRLDPNLYFYNFNCTSIDTESLRPPFPNLRSIYPELMNEDDSTLFDSQPYPTLDLHITDVAPMTDDNNRYSDANHHSSTRSTSFSHRNSERQDRVLKKRHLSNHCKHHNYCQKTVSFVTFSELGLGGSLIAPNGINWISCLKNVSSLETNPFRNINVTIDQANKDLQQNLRGSEEFECVPSNWESLPLLSINSGEIQYSLMENFIPTSCICKTL